MSSLLAGLVRLVGVCFFCLATSGTLFAVTIWDEAITEDGDLSGTRTSPTMVSLSEGTNTLLGATSMGDLDYLTVTVPAGHEFSELTLVSFVSTDDIAFAGMGEGAVIDPTSAPANLLGYTHFGTGPGAVHVGSDMLPAMGVSAGAIGFTPPLDSGQYAFWIQQAAGAPVTYQFDFIVTALAGAPGDYNGDGTVNAADYTVWRNAVEAGATTILNEGAGISPGAVDQADYAFWRDHYGDVLGSGAADSATIPEPSSAVLLCIAAAGLLTSRRRSLTEPSLRQER